MADSLRKRIQYGTSTWLKVTIHKGFGKMKNEEKKNSFG
jgi:hypothetical protein